MSASHIACQKRSSDQGDGTFSFTLYCSFITPKPIACNVDPRNAKSTPIKKFDWAKHSPCQPQ
eukprot:3865139-Rhodomonas_salina.2